MKRLSSVVAATLASIALVLGAVSAPAFADDPVPGPVATDEAATPEPTPAPTETPTETPSESPTPTPTPTPTGALRGTQPAAVSPGMQDLTGTIVELSDIAAPGSVKVFSVQGEGYLSIDFSAVTLPADPSTPITVRVAAPAGTVGDANGVVAFDALAAAASPLVATQIGSPSVFARSFDAMVNQTPATTSTHQVYAVSVTPANVCGSSCAVTSSQSVANIQADVAAANTYWLSQSDGKVGFELVGTTAWYKSAYSCDANTPSNFVNLMNEARLKAAAQIGYVRAANVHLVLIFPSGSNCGPAVGIGTVGYSVNEGGSLWAVGSGQSGAVPTEFHTLAHELGHNLSLGHASWLDCTSATPAPGTSGTTGCTVNPYGDAADVMGQGYYLYAQGSLSSAHAIRSGLWSASSYSNAPTGSSSYTLKPLSGGTGLRSVVVEGTNGVNYFVEFRDTSGIDAPYSTLGCPFYTGLCTATTSGVRILQLEQQNYFDGYDNYQFKGFPGDDSYLIGRTVSGVKKANFVAGESITIGGATISVTSITGSGASITVNRAFAAPTAGTVYIQPTAGSGSSWPWYAGDTLTAMLGSTWKADTYDFEWVRNGAAIGVFTQNYTLTAADVGQYIGVRVFAHTGYCCESFGQDPDLSTYLGYGPIQPGITQGTVSINASTLPFTAVPAGWNTTGVSYSYQWRRNGAVIPGATAATYTPVAADDGNFLSVRLTASKPGANAVVAFSASKNYTLSSSGSVAITGTLKVGQSLSADSALAYSTVDGAVSPTLSYQWYRSGEVISGATGGSYTLAAADLSKVMTVRVYARASGYASSSALSTASSTVLRGTITGSLAPPQVTVDASTLKLTVGLPAGSITEPAVTYSYQWYRDGVAVTGAIAATYQLTIVDYGKAIHARVIVTKTAFNSATLYSSPTNYSVAASGTLAVQGTAQVGLTVSASALSYATSDGPVTPVLSYVWYRNGVAIGGATASSYSLVAADSGTALAVRVTASVSGFVASSVLSSSVTVGKGVLSGDLASPVVTKDLATMKLTAALAAGSVTDAGIAVAYQWYRDGVAVVGATAATFSLTAADYGKNIAARLTVTKFNYTTVVLTSSPANYSVASTGSLTVDGTLQVGATVAPSALSYSTSEGAVSPTVAYAWFRNGIAIIGATASTYTLVAADFGTKLSVRVTAAAPGFLSQVATSPQTGLVAKGVLSGDFALPVVSKSPALLLSASLPVGSVTDGGTALAYQWLRDGVAIVGATAATFQLTAADYGKSIAARVTVNKLNYSSVTLTSAGSNYSVIPSGSLTVEGTPQVGLTVSASALSYPTVDGAVAPTLTYIWYRNGIVIAGATASTYVVVAADFGTKLSVRVTATQAGFLPHVVTSPQSALVVKGVLSGDFAVPTVAKSGTLLLSAALPVGSVTDAGTTLGYQWLRDGVAIVGATAATFQLTAADYGKSIAVRVTVNKLNFTSVTLTSAGSNYSVASTGSLTVDGTLQVGLTVSASALSYTTLDGAVSLTPAYAWFRNGIAIIGATASTYTLVAADFGTKLSVRVTAAAPGFLSQVATSPQTGLVAKGVLSGDFALPVVSKSPALLLSASLPVGSVTDAGTTLGYQWLRDGVAIVGATAATFQLTAADYGKSIAVRVTVNKLNFTSVVLTSLASNHSVATATAVPTFTGLVEQDETLTVVDRVFTAAGDEITPVLAYQWLRDGIAIAGATSPSYLQVTADLGKSLSVRVTASYAGFLPSISTSAVTQKVGVSTLAGWDQQPTVSRVSSTSLVLTAVQGVTEPGAVPAYQWLRGGVAIVGATAASFTLTAADYGKRIAVRVTSSKATFTTAVNTSADADYSVAATGTLTADGTPQVGLVLTASTLAYTTSDGPVTPTLTYAWLRNGVVIAGATGSTYTQVAADFGTRLSVRVTAAVPGFLPSIVTSAQTGLVAKGVLSGDFAAPTVVKSGTLLLSASLPLGSVTDTGTTLAYQWLRNGTAIAGATAATFQLTAADYGTNIAVRITVSKLNYNQTMLTSPSANYSVAATGLLTVVGTAQVGLIVAPSTLSYTTSDGPVAPTLSYTWYRNNVAIIGATASTYTLVAADFGTKLSVRVTAAVPGFLSHAAISPQSGFAVKGVLSGDFAVPTVAKSGTLLLSASLPVGSVTDAGTTLAYQWLRDGVAIVGATAATFQLTAADYGKSIAVRVTVNKLNFTSVTLTSLATNHSVAATGSLTVEGTPQVGLAVSASALSYSTVDGAVAPTLTYVWYRNGIVIAGATASTYVVVAADFGTKLSVRVTATQAGFLPHVVTSPQSALVVKGVLSGDFAVPTVAKSGTLLLSAALPVGSVTDAGTTLAYQWLRDGVAIVGATAATFQLTAADYGKSIAVRVTVSKLNFTSVVLTSVASNHSVATATAVPTFTGLVQLGQTLTVVDRVFTAAGDEITPVLTYQWLRDGVAIPTATGVDYAQVAADLGKSLSVRVTASYAGFLPSISTSAVTQKVGSFTLDNWNLPPTVSRSALMLTATQAVGSGAVPAYQWLRGGVAIVGATAASFTLTAADYGKRIAVRVTSSKATFTTAVNTSADTDYSVAATGTLTADGTPQVGLVLTASTLAYTTSDGPVTPTLTYAWFRNGVAIAGATASSYTQVAADFGTRLSVRVTAAVPGFLPSIVTSAQTGLVAKGVLSGDFAVPVVGASASALLTASLPVGSVTDTGTTLAYQWLRNGVAIIGATAATFQLTAAADYGKDIAVRITVSKLNYTPVTLSSVALNHSVAATGTLAVVGALQVGLTVSASALSYTTRDGAVTPTLAHAWYRNGIAIAGATASTYTLVAADFGTKLSVRVTAAQPGFLAHVLTSPQTALAVKGVLSGDLAIPVVAKSGTLLLSAALPVGSVTDAGTTLAYQWLRDGVAIVGATAATFQLTAADYGKSIAVRVTVNKLNFTPVTLTSAGSNYSVIPSGTQTASGTAQVGLTLSAGALTYSTAAGPSSAVVSYQWLRNGVVIAGATGSTYAVAAADLATKLSVRVTAAEAGYLASVATSAPSATVVAGVLSGDMAAPTLTSDPATMKLTAALTPGSVTDPGIAVTFQWYRNGLAISGATAASYTLSAADYGQEIRGRLVVSKLNYTTVVLYTATIIP